VSGRLQINFFAPLVEFIHKHLEAQERFSSMKWSRSRHLSGRQKLGEFRISALESSMLRVREKKSKELICTPNKI